MARKWKQLCDASTAQEVKDNGDQRQHQQDVNHAAAHVKGNETEQPQHQQNQPEKS